MNNTKIITIPLELNRMRLDKALSKLCPELTRTRIKTLILQGHVKLEQVSVVSPDHKVSANQEISLTIPVLQEATPQPQNIPLNIVYEDQDIIVINKPAGLVVHPAPGNPDKTLVNALLFHCGDELSGIGGVKRPGIVHRLDKETSGLLVVAKNDAAHQNLCHQLANRTLGREYIAVVWGLPKPTSGVIEGNIGRHPRHRQKMALLTYGGKSARTQYRIEELFGLYAARVRCKLETGRTHQIRVHMASIGNPIIGDQIYGRIPRTIPKDLKMSTSEFGVTNNRHALHAIELHLLHPQKNTQMQFHAEIPEDMQELTRQLKQFIQNLG